jgi:hypothetical protein
MNAAAEYLQVTGSIQHIEELVTFMSLTPPFLNIKDSKQTRNEN